MMITFSIVAAGVTWTMAADYDPGNGTRDAGEEPELDLRRGHGSDGRELTGLALDAELDRAGVTWRLMGLAREAYGRRLRERAGMRAAATAQVTR